MIKLDRIEQHRLGSVVQKLGALVKKGRVVLVALNRKVGAGPELIAPAKIPAQPADQKAGLESGPFQHPGQQRRGGGLAVRSGNHQGTLVGQEKLGQGLREGHIRNPGVEQSLDFRVGARHRIADHDQIGRRV